VSSAKTDCGKLRSTGERGSSAKGNEERLLADKGPEIK